MVTGGYNLLDDIDSTELFDSSVGAWRLIEGSLPMPMSSMKAATVDNRVLVFGKTFEFIFLLFERGIFQEDIMMNQGFSTLSLNLTSWLRCGQRLKRT